MYVKKSGFVISLKEETMLKARQKDNLLDILQSSYPFYQLLDETDSCEDCRKKSGRIYPVSEAEIGINFPPFHPNCRCTAVGILHDHKMDPWEQENAIWDFLFHPGLSKEYQVQLLRNYYSISRQVHSDISLQIKLESSINSSSNRMEIIESFINRLNPDWIDPNLETRFQYNWNSKYTTPPFKQKTSDIASILGVSPDDLMKVMAAESRIEPTSGNEFAIGLIQFTDIACEHIGTTRQALAKMSAIEQLDYVYLYFKDYIGKLEDAVDLYWVMCTTKPIGKGDYDVVYDSRSNPSAYNGNAGMDHDKDGKITRRDLKEHLEIQLEDYWTNWSD